MPSIASWGEWNRSNRLKVFCKIAVRRNSAKFTRQHLCQSLFNKKLAYACNLIKKETLAQVFSCKFCEISKTTFSYRTHRWLLLNEIDTISTFQFHIKLLFYVYTSTIHICKFFLQYFCCILFFICSFIYLFHFSFWYKLDSMNAIWFSIYWINGLHVQLCKQLRWKNK